MTHIVGVHSGEAFAELLISVEFSFFFSSSPTASSPRPQHYYLSPFTSSPFLFHTCQILSHRHCTTTTFAPSLSPVKSDFALSPYLLLLSNLPSRPHVRTTFVQLSDPNSLYVHIFCFSLKPTLTPTSFVPPRSAVKSVFASLLIFPVYRSPTLLRPIPRSQQRRQLLQ